MSATEASNDIFGDYSAPYSSHSPISNSHFNAHSGSNASSSGGENSFSFYPPGFVNTSDRNHHQTQRFSTPARAPLHQLNTETNTNVSQQHTIDVSLECQQMLENFNALEDICKNTAMQQTDFKDLVLQKMDELKEAVERNSQQQEQQQQQHQTDHVRKVRETPHDLSRTLRHLVAADESLAFNAKEGTVAVRRNYESQRIKERENGNIQIKNKNSKRRKSNSSRCQTMKRRSRVLSSDEEREVWRNLTPELMSDEEEGDDDTTIVLSAPACRSQRLNSLICQLDERLKDKGVFKRFIKKTIEGRIVRESQTSHKIF
ncbi:uncharacterized protein LOC144343516 [Saccoglossus kowalevskii]